MLYTKSNGQISMRMVKIKQNWKECKKTQTKLNNRRIADSKKAGRYVISEKEK